MAADEGLDPATAGVHHRPTASRSSISHCGKAVRHRRDRFVPSPDRPCQYHCVFIYVYVLFDCLPRVYSNLFVSLCSVLLLNGGRETRGFRVLTCFDADGSVVLLT